MASVTWIVDGEAEGWGSIDGCTRGTYLHGLFESAAARRRLLDWARTRTASRPSLHLDARAVREAAYERLADTLEQVLDRSVFNEVLTL